MNLKPDNTEIKQILTKPKKNLLTGDSRDSVDNGGLSDVKLNEAKLKSLKVNILKTAQAKLDELETQAKLEGSPEQTKELLKEVLSAYKDTLKLLSETLEDSPEYKEIPSLKIDHSNSLHLKIFPPFDENDNPIYKNGDLIPHRPLATIKDFKGKKTYSWYLNKYQLSEEEKKAGIEKNAGHFIETFWKDIKGMTKAIISKPDGCSTLQNDINDHYDNLVKKGLLIAKEMIPVEDVIRWVVEHPEANKISHLPTGLQQKYSKYKKLFFNKCILIEKI